MTQYEALQRAAEAARNRYFGARDQVIRSLALLVHTLSEDWGVPPDAVVFLRSDEEPQEDGSRIYRLSEEGMIYSLPGATVFDSADGYWRLGVRINLTKNQLPERFLFFPFAMTFRKGATWIKHPATSEEIEFDADNLEQHGVISRELHEHFLEAFNADPVTIGIGSIQGHGDVRRKIGFHVDIVRAIDSDL